MLKQIVLILIYGLFFILLSMLLRICIIFVVDMEYPKQFDLTLLIMNLFAVAVVGFIAGYCSKFCWWQSSLVVLIHAFFGTGLFLLDYFNRSDTVVTRREYNVLPDSDCISSTEIIIQDTTNRASTLFNNPLVGVGFCLIIVVLATKIGKHLKETHVVVNRT